MALRALKRLLVGWVLVLVPLVLACQAVGPEPAAPPPTGPQGSIIIAQSADVATLDIHFGPSTPAFNVLHNLQDMLFKPDAELNLKPWMAESFSISADQLTWTIKLRKGITFHNGEPFTGETVRYSLLRTIDPSLTEGQKPTKDYAREINLARVDVVDDHTVNIVTKEPTPHVIARLADDGFMLPPKYYGSTPLDKVRGNPVGSGPWAFKEYVKDEFVRLEAHPQYWAKTAGLVKGPLIQTVTFKPIPEAASRIAALETGAVDIITEVPPDQGERIQRSEKLKFVSLPGTRRMYVGINQEKHPALTKKEVRQAMNYAVDTQKIVDTILQGATKRITTLQNPPYVHPTLKPYPYDPAKAKQLLAQAGYPEGFSVELETPAARWLRDKEVSEAVTGYLGAVGIKATVRVMEWATYWGEHIQRKTLPSALYFLGTAGFFDPFLELNIARHTHSSNVTNWKDPEFLSLYDKATKAMLAEEERRKIAYRMQEILHEEAPFIYLYTKPDLYGMNKRVDVKPDLDERIRLHDARLIQ